MPIYDRSLGKGLMGGEQVQLHANYSETDPMGCLYGDLPVQFSSLFIDPHQHEDNATTLQLVSTISQKAYQQFFKT